MDVGKVLIIIGSFILTLGLITSYAPWLINWFGRLPGDIHIKNEHSVVFIPVTSMIVVSILLTALVNLFFRK
ncbi:DUF2905 domain-containing protein [methane-oxidizing endosymbiont of Gigantopelta aegis]|uniref:DUF2905 domain-containing protein n=1 Tax=methane-oxidizing endosymbiont of Gigantopelta aegis TaxID=2794938 RepID=UPI0018DDE258|nr:DUF2905 domain-containing protein [methane-oxidizing endosymbiont of Gigantopelta aegis]